MVLYEYKQDEKTDKIIMYTVISDRRQRQRGDFVDKC